MILPWECHDQSQENSWRQCFTGRESSFFHKRKGILKIDHCVRMSRHGLSKRVVCSYSSALGYISNRKIIKYCLLATTFRSAIQHRGRRRRVRLVDTGLKEKFKHDPRTSYIYPALFCWRVCHIDKIYQICHRIWRQWHDQRTLWHRLIQCVDTSFMQTKLA